MGMMLGPAGWPLRRFRLDEIAAILTPPPPVIEVSKDLLRDEVSLKDLASALDRIRAGGSGAPGLSFAGTTDLVSCAGFPWERYRQYLAVQIAQARFLGATMFRMFLGRASGDVSTGMLIERVNIISADTGAIALCIEIHAGVESQPDTLAALVRETPARFVVDFENMRHARLSLAEVFELIPADRIAYFHQRNLPGVWVEDPESESDEVQAARRCPAAAFLWEPKAIDAPARIQELFLEYRATH